MSIKAPFFHSLYGNKFYLSKDGYAISETEGITVESTSVALKAGGISNLTTAGTYALPAPIPGVSKRLVCTTTSTGVRTINAASNTSFQSTLGSSYVSYTLAGGGQYLSLLGMSTAIWMVMGTNSSATPT